MITARRHQAPASLAGMLGLISSHHFSVERVHSCTVAGETVILVELACRSCSASESLVFAAADAVKLSRALDQVLIPGGVS